jgi:hypothetical protein
MLTERKINEISGIRTPNHKNFKEQANGLEQSVKTKIFLLNI